MAKEKSKKRKTKWYPGKLLEAVTGAKKRRLKKAYEAEHPKLINAKEMAKERASGAGRVRKGAVGAEVTEGGAYAKYKAGSKAAKSFKSAFADASEAGEKTFEWDGRSYTTEKKQLGGKVEPPTAPSLSPQPSYKEGGKVESNPYGWPSRDARNGGKK